VIYVLGVDIAASPQYEAKLMFRLGKLWYVGRFFFFSSLKGAQGKFEARVVAYNVAFHEATSEFWCYVMVHNAEGIGFGYNDQRLSIAQPHATDLNDLDVDIPP
jgi:hypothetical protein